MQEVRGQISDVPNAWISWYLRAMPTIALYATDLERFFVEYVLFGAYGEEADESNAS